MSDANGYSEYVSRSIVYARRLEKAENIYTYHRGIVQGVKGGYAYLDAQGYVAYAEGPEFDALYQPLGSDKASKGPKFTS